MKLSDIEARLVGYYLSGKSIYLKSAPGRGKTSVLASAPSKIGAATGKNLGLVIINGPLLTPADSVGYLVPRKVVGADGVERMESVYTDPFWFRTKEGKRLSEYDGGIIVVDEADKMDVDVKKVIGEAALSGRLGPHQLPDGWRLWMAGNRQKDRSGSTKELDHLINRRMEIEVTDDIHSWNTWASSHGVSPVTMAFANQHTGVVFSDGVPEKQGPWCTPRSLVEADDYMKTVRSLQGSVAARGTDDDGKAAIIVDAHLMEEVAGMIGDGAAAQLASFIKLEIEMPSYEDIVANPGKAKVPGKPDAAMLVCYNLAHRVVKAEASAVIEYVMRLPSEFSVIFAKSAVQRDPSLVATPGFVKWVQQNSSLMAAIGTSSRK